MWQLVDDYLNQTRALLGTGTPALPAPPSPAPANPLTPNTWIGMAATTATATTQQLGTKGGQLAAAQSQTGHQLTAAADISRTAHHALNAIQTSWESDKAALSPFARTREGQSALNRAGQQRIIETETLVNGTATKYGTAAANVRTAQLGLPAIDDPNTTPDPSDDPTRPGLGHSRPGRPDHPDPDRRQPPGDPRTHNTQRGAPSLPNAATGLATNRTLSPITGARTPMTSTAPAAGMPLTGATPTSALSTPLQPLEQTLEQAATPATDTSHHNDDSPAGDGDKVVNAARRALGMPYVWGGGNATGSTGGGFDCSGLVQYSVAQATNGQLILPRTTYEQIHCGRLTNLADVRPGDLVFSNFSAPGVPEHVQIYAGQGRVIEAQQSGVPVEVSALPAGQIVIKRVT